MRRLIFTLACLFISCDSLAHTQLIKLLGYQGQIITIGEISTSQGQSGIAINLPGYGDIRFVPLNVGTWNNGKLGHRLFTQHWIGDDKATNFITLQTFQHEENKEMDVAVYFGKEEKFSFLTLLAEKNYL